jgi:hypothetical protein
MDHSTLFPLFKIYFTMSSITKVRVHILLWSSISPQHSYCTQSTCSRGKSSCDQEGIRRQQLSTAIQLHSVRKVLAACAAHVFVTHAMGMSETFTPASRSPIVQRVGPITQPCAPSIRPVNHRTG